MKKKGTSVNSKAKWASAIAAVGIPVSLVVAADSPPVGFVVLLGLVAAGTFSIPNFGWLMRAGVFGGAAAGLLVLGPGLQVVMRIVAIMDPIRQPEFSAGETGFIVLSAGFMGLVFGAGIALIRDAFQVSGVVVALLAAAGGMTVFLAGAELRGELFGLGAGAWVNIPMFAVAWGLYGLAAVSTIGRFGRRSTQAPSARVDV